MQRFIYFFYPMYYAIRNGIDYETLYRTGTGTNEFIGE